MDTATRDDRLYVAALKDGSALVGRMISGEVNDPEIREFPTPGEAFAWVHEVSERVGCEVEILPSAKRFVA